MSTGSTTSTHDSFCLRGEIYYEEVTKCKQLRERSVHLELEWCADRTRLP